MNFKILFSLIVFSSSAFAFDNVPDSVERQVLLSIYQETNGSNWNLDTANLWTIEKINSYPQVHLYGIGTSNGDISSISLSGFGLTGSIPTGINLLTEITTLRLSSNSLSGVFPNLTALTKLKELRLAGNNFSGTIPDNIFGIVSLETLDLSGAGFTGPIPTSIGNLQSLTKLYLNNVNLGALNSIPDQFSLLDNLQDLELSSCSLSNLTATFGFDGLASLIRLNLNNNPTFNHNGSFVDIFSNLPALQELYLKSNAIQKLPSGIKSLQYLNYLDLEANNFGDSLILKSISDTIKHCLSLNTLILSNCSIKSLPLNFSEINSVTTLYLRFNPLLPEECEEIALMDALKTLYVNNCGLTDLPGNLSASTSLEELYAYNNSLNPIPEILKDVPNLKLLNLQSNSIASIPSWLPSNQIIDLEKLYLDNNLIALPIPSNFGSFTNLKVLRLSSNKLEGVLPDLFASLTTVEELNLSYNKIDQLPDLSSLTSLHSLNLRNNNLSGTVPEFMTNVTSLKTFLDISDNNYDAVTPLAHFTGSNVTVNVGGNAMTFEDVLKLKPAVGVLNCSPQDSVDVKKDVKAYYTGIVVFKADVDTLTNPGSLFQWFKIDDNGYAVALGGASEVNKNFTATITWNDQERKYFYKITNPSASLTLVSRPQTLLIICDVLPTSATFTTEQFLCAVNFIPDFTYPEGCRTKSYNWNFGDGASSIEKSPLHAYGSAGNYDALVKVRYTCGLCLRDTIVHNSVNFQEQTNVFQDSLITIMSDLKTDIISNSLSTFSDSWPVEKSISGNSLNEFENASKGIWRNKSSYVYKTSRNSSSQIDVSKDGTYSMEQFNWEFEDMSAIPNWIKTNTVTKYSDLSYEIENKDVLGIHSSAIYDYGGNLPTANALNARSNEIAFSSFEFIENDISGNWTLGNHEVSRQVKYDVYSADKFVAIIKASMDELEDVEEVDIYSRGLTLFFNSRFLKSVKIICKQPFPQNPEWTMVTLRKAPFEGLWFGSISFLKKSQQEAVATIDSSFGHTGKKSLKISGSQVFKQPLLVLDSNKVYYLSCWASVNDQQLVQQSLGNNIGATLRFKDNGGQIISQVFLEPSGTIIEGWQQIRGSFKIPSNAVQFDIVFSSGDRPTTWFDDLRLYPQDGNMKSYVYDINTYRLSAILDEENYATLFYYDAEGNLYVTKKETEEGIRVLSESITYSKENK